MKKGNRMGSKRFYFRIVSILLLFLLFYAIVTHTQPPQPTPSFTPSPPPQADLEGFYIKAISWNGDYWLIGGTYPVEAGSNLSYTPLLLRFDGANFLDLSNQLNLKNKVDRIAWNGDHWLIAYSFQEYGGLKKYDGRSFSDVPLPGKQPTLRVNSMEWNGDYWLIGSGYMGHGYLLRYDGREIKELTPKSKLASIRSISWIKDHWLISGADSSGNERLMKYDGAVFVDAGKSLYGGVYSWNGEYWLVRTPGKLSKLLKYDGIEFTDLTEKSGFGKERVSGVSWNGEYWLIGGEKGKLMKYDGVVFTDLTYKASLKGIEAIAWGGGYWLIGGPGTLQKYDGSSFTDLTPQLKAALPPS